MATRLATATQNAACDAMVDLVDGGAAAGTIKIYTGSQPASANDAPTGTLLATFTLNDPAFGAAAAGVADLDVSPALTTTGAADGTAGWFRCESSTPATIFDGACGTSGQQLNLNTLTISIGVNVEITSGTYTMPAA